MLVSGTDGIPAADAERFKRASHLGRIREPEEEANVVVFPTSFHVKEGTECDDPGRMSKQADLLPLSPFQQAEYAYSLIESEVSE